MNVEMVARRHPLRNIATQAGFPHGVIWQTKSG